MKKITIDSCYVKDAKLTNLPVLGGKRIHGTIEIEFSSDGDFSEYTVFGQSVDIRKLNNLIRENLKEILL